MSGSNPFRHRQPVESTAVAPPPTSFNQDPTSSRPDEIIRASSRFPPLTVESTSTPRPSPKPKTVRIASPPVPISPDTPLISASPTPTTSPVFSRRPLPPGTLIREGGPGSSFPNDTEPSPVDPFNAEASDGDDQQDEEVAFNTERNLKISAESPASTGAAPGPSQREENDPVKATLAKFVGGPRRGPDGKPNVHSSKPSMDVDAFKRLLLTGSSTLPAGVSPAPAPLPPQGGSSDSSSNTDAASVSRQSIFEPHSAVQNETPRTSHEISLSDDERARLVTDASEGKKKPPPPKARHGKLIKNNPPPPSAGNSSPVPLNPDENPIPDDLNVNKPLPPPPPPPPPSESDGFIPHAPPRSETEPLSSSVLDPSSQSQPKKQRPPTPPLARRHSERKPSSKRNPRLSLDPSTLTSPTDSKLPSFSPSFKTPPPPPSRRQADNKQSNSPGSNSPPASLRSPSYDLPSPPNPSQSSVSTTAKITTDSMPSPVIQPPTPLTAPPTSNTSKPPSSRPPPPPARTSSSASMKRLSRVPSHARDSPISSTSINPPPPPPPRRSRGTSASSFESGARISSRESFDGRRPSADILSGLEGGGIGSRHLSESSIGESDLESEIDNGGGVKEKNEGVGVGGKGVDIMADLDRLRRELDAYRGQIEGGGKA